MRRHHRRYRIWVCPFCGTPHLVRPSILPFECDYCPVFPEPTIEEEVKNDPTRYVLPEDM